MTRKQHRRLSYLLRLWPVQGAGQTVWRASLENPHTGEQLGFATLERLFAFLEDQTLLAADEQSSPPNP
jgi:hypothetical protein